MNKKKLAVSAMLAALAAFSPAGIGQDAGVAYAFTQEEQYCYECNGILLWVPKVYDDLLVTTLVKNEKDGMLFSVSEKASIAAAKHLPYEMQGAGWLFSIGRVDEGRLHELLCGDMSGAEIFGRDTIGRYYVFYHPTDVRYVRENNEAMKRDQAQWTMLNEWAWKSVREELLRENGLETTVYDNSTVGMAIARAAYDPEVRYTVSTTENGPIELKNFDAAPYAELLLQNASYEPTDNEAPDGEYVVLDFPDEGVRFDFFLMKDKENYVREVRQDGYEALYKANFYYGSARAGAVMKEWYDAMMAPKG